MNIWRLCFGILFLICSRVLWAAPLKGDQDLFKRSLELYGQNKFAQSSQILIHLIRKNPRNTLYWFNLGNCYFMARKYELAAQYFSQVIRLQSPLSAAAKLYRAKALTQMGNRKEAEELLQHLVGENPPAGILQEARADLGAFSEKENLESAALTAYQKGQYSAAEQSLRSLGAEISPDGRLLLGMSLAKQNKNPQAEGVLKGLLAMPALNEDHRGLARRLLESVRRQQDPYWLILEASYGSADNVYLEGRSLTPIKSELMRAGLEAGYQFYKGPLWSQKGVYVYNNETPSTVSDLRTQSHSLMFPLLYQGSRLGVVLDPFFQIRVWDQTSVSEKVGAVLDVAQEWRESSVGLEVRGESQNARTALYNYLSGSSYFVRPYYEWGEKYFSAQIHWLFGFDGTQDIVYTDGSRLPLTQSYQGPGIRLSWSPSRRWDFGLYWSHLRRAYVHVALPGEKKRSDTETEVSLKIAYAVSSEWGVYGLLESVINNSSLGDGEVRDKNYKATTSSVGMNWRVF